MTKTFSERLGALTPAIGVLVLVGIWSIAHALKVADPVLLPSPSETFGELWKGLAGGTLAHDAWITVLRTLYSFAIALAVGVPLGIVLGASDRIYRSIEFVIDFFRSTPASVVFPLFLVLFGTGEKTKIAVAAFGAALVILFNVAYGVMNARKQRMLAAKVMGANPWQVMADVTVWESLPQTFVGIRSGISLALVIVIVAEMFIGSTDGLGHRVVNAQMVFEMPTMYAAIFTAGLLGYALNLLFIVMERRFVHWSGR
ncbi:MAG: ABC transporter permease [Comamonadaceae bacterium]|nr:MAG: ABC transporter permease [Comamonadaceae bacterium]